MSWLAPFMEACLQCNIVCVNRVNAMYTVAYKVGINLTVFHDSDNVIYS